MKLYPAIVRARRVLGRAHLGRSISTHAPILLGVAGACAALRPVVWPLHDASPWLAVVRSSLLAGVGTSLVVSVVLARAWRTRPSELAAARRVDDALGLAEVVASGFAFERDRRSDPMSAVAIGRAHDALSGVTLERVLVAPPAKRSRRASRWLAAATTLAIVGFAFGAIDRLLIERTIHPMTAEEKSAAAALASAAAAATHFEGDKDPSPSAKPMKDAIDAARRASQAAERGDRKRAEDALEDLRKATRDLDASEREQARSLRAVRDALDGADDRNHADSAAEAGPGKESRPSPSASEAIAKMKKDADSAKDPESVRKLAERLERAEAAARAQADSAKSTGASSPDPSKSSSSSRSGQESAWSRAAEALKEAREAARRGDTEGMKRAMERAEREIAALERERREARSMSRVVDRASELDRSMHAAKSGAAGKDGSAKGSKSGRQGGRDGDGDGDGKDGDPKSGKGSPASGNASGRGASGAPGPGGGPGGDVSAAAADQQRRLKVNGNLQARTDVREGERAVSAIEGMGRGDDPRAYSEVFPSYDSAVEDGLREEVVPAARRPTVRRYFSSIRPSASGAENSKERP